MKLENALNYKKETSEIFEDYSYIREVVDLERPFYIWAEEPGGDIPYRVIDSPNPNIKITNIIEKEKLIQFGDNHKTTTNRLIKTKILSLNLVFILAPPL